MQRIFMLLVFIGLFWSCDQDNLILKNDLNIQRNDEVVVISKKDLSKIDAIEKGLLPIFLIDNTPVASQIDDLDGDGSWDEVALLIDFSANETKTLNIGFLSADKYPSFTKRTNLRLGIKKADHEFDEVDQHLAPAGLDGFPTIAQGESVSWENDKIAFRNYFDCRNIKDLFGKLQPALIIDKIHTKEFGSYHKLADWGMDVLHCGSSLGAGGLAMMENDSLYRLGSTDVYEYQKVIEGPVRSIFDLKYKGWKVADEKLNAVERISIYPGKYWFQSDVTVNGFSGQKQLATGIVTSHLKNEPKEFETTNSFKVLATLDKQSLNNDELGMAVMIPSDEAINTGRTTNINFYQEGYETVPPKKFSHVISETAYITQKIENDKAARHYFFSVWGLEDSKWKEFNNFKEYMNSEATKFANPILVEIQ